MTDENDARLTRQLIREELDASNSYEEKAQATSDPEAARVYRDISREEKVHAGELQALLDREDPESTEAMKEGMEETGLEGSFKDIFDRKREDYIHKSVYGTHVEKANLDSKQREMVDRGRKSQAAMDAALAEASAQGQTDAANEYKNGFAYEAQKLASIGDLLFNNYKKGAQEIGGLSIGDALELYNIYDDRGLYSEYELNLSPIERGIVPYTIAPPAGSHQDAVDSAKTVEYAPISMPKNENIKGVPEEVLRERNLAEAAARSTADPDADEKHLSQTELYSNRNPSGKARPLQTTSRVHTGGGTDYGLNIESPEYIGASEVEEYVKRGANLDENVDENGKKAPSSEKRPWLTWRYFGKYGNIPTIQRRQVKDEQGKPVYRYMGVRGANGQMLMRKIPVTEVVMNYRFSRKGKDRLYEQFTPLRTVWNPSAFNPATRKCTGAFVPEGALLDKRGDVIEDTATRFQNPITDIERANSSPDAKGSRYEVDPLTGKKRRVGDRLNFEKWGNMDQWDFYNMHCAMQALADGVRRCMTDENFRAKVEAIPPSEIAVKYQNEVARYLMTQEDMQGIDPIMIRNMVGKVSTYYDDFNKGLAAQKKAASAFATAREAMIEEEATERMRDQLRKWTESANIKGLNGEDVEFDNLTDFFDDNTGTLHLMKGGKPFDIPLQNVLAWVDHQIEFHSGEIRMAENDAVEAEKKINAELEKRRRIEDQHIEDYIRQALYKDYEERKGVDWMSNAPDMIDEKANLLTQALLYGDGSVFNEYMGGELESGLDAREYFLKKSNFNWDQFVADRELLRQRADLALSIEVGRLSDPRFHEAVAEAETQAKLTEKYGVAAALVSAHGDSQAFEMMKEDEDTSLESAMQAYMNRSKHSSMYSQGKNIADMGVLLGSGMGQADAYKQFVRDRLSKDKDFQAPENEDDWEGVYYDMAGKGMDKALWNAVSNVKDALNTDPEFEQLLLDKKGAFKGKAGVKAIQEFIDTMKNGTEADIVNMIKAGGQDNDRLLWMTLNGSNLARLSKSPDYQNLRDLKARAEKEGVKFNIPSLKEGRMQLIRKINNALQGGARESYAFDKLREVSAKQLTQMLVDGTLAEQAVGSGNQKTLAKAQELYETTLDQLVREAMVNRAKMAVDNAPREPRLPDENLKKWDPDQYNKAMKRYNDAKAEYDRANAEYTDLVEKEFNLLINDPEKMEAQREVMKELAAQKVIPKIVRKRSFREIIATLLGNKPEMMVEDNYSTLSDQTHYTDDDFLGRQKDELSMEEQLQERIAPFKAEGKSDFDALVDSYKAQGMSEGQARQRAFMYLDSRGLDLDEGADRRTLLHDWGSADININGDMGIDIDQTTEEEQRKFINSAINKYFDNYLADLARKVESGELTPDETHMKNGKWVKVPSSAYKWYKDYMAADAKGKNIAKLKWLLDRKLLAYTYDATGKPNGIGPNWHAFSGKTPDQVVSEEPIAGSEDGTKRIVSLDHPEYLEGRDILNQHLKTLSLNDARRLGLGTDSVTGYSKTRYNIAFDKIVREELVKALTDKYKTVGANEFEGPLKGQAAGNLAKRTVDEQFKELITPYDATGDHNKEFIAKLAKYGLSPEKINGLKVRAMKVADTPLYNDFLKGYFDSSGRAAGADRDADELSMFENLISGEEGFQQNPALTQAWNEYANKPGTLTQAQAQAMGDVIRGGVSRKLGDIASRQRAMKDFISDYPTIGEKMKRIDFLNKGIQRYRDHANNPEVQEYLEELRQEKLNEVLALRQEMSRKRKWVKQLEFKDPVAYAVITAFIGDPDEAYAEPDIPEELLRSTEDVPYMSHVEFDSDDPQNKIYNRAMGGLETQSKSYGTPKEFAGMNGRYNTLVGEAVRRYAQEKGTNPESYFRGFSAMDPSEFMEALTDSVMRHIVYRQYHKDNPIDSKRSDAKKPLPSTEDSERIAGMIYQGLISNPDSRLLFKGVKQDWNPKPTKENASKEEGDYKTWEQGKLARWMEIDKLVGATSNNFDTENKIIPPSGRKSDYDEALSENDLTGDDLSENKQLKTDLRTISDAPVGQETQIKNPAINSGGKDLKIESMRAANNITLENNAGFGQSNTRADAIVEKVPERRGEGEELGNPWDSPDTSKKEASAFDTPFADILSSKRSQTIRKNETGTVISTDTVSAPMTEQADAPQEQNSVEAGGFAELMKSKMASTHMMEEPSEEREDWIPMRNGYRRVTIGSGKDCVRSMMRNPPRSANAPGTRTRKV